MAEFRVTTKGPSFDRLIDDSIRSLRAANREAGRKIATAGRKAVRDKAPRMWGKKLTVKTKTRAYVDRAEVSFIASPAGGWAMAEKGTRPHKIRPRRRKALHYGPVFADHVNHPGTAGDKAWTKALVRLKAAIDPVVDDAYDEALGG